MTALAFPWRTLGPLEIPPKPVLKGDPPVGSQPHGAAAAIPGHARHAFSWCEGETWEGAPSWARGGAGGTKVGETGSEPALRALPRFYRRQAQITLPHKSPRSDNP